jgi:spermidine synthase
MQSAAHDASCPMVPRPVLFMAVCSFGVSAFMTQLVLMRELVAAFSGNELIFGIVLGNWMLLTGIGSTLGKTAPRLKSPILLLVVFEILIAILPVADVFLLRTMRNIVFIRGAEVGLTETVATCLVLMAPYCLVTGYILTLACFVAASGRDVTVVDGKILPSPFGRGDRGEGALPLTLSQRERGHNGVSQRERGQNGVSEGERGQNSIGKVYFFDNLGGVLGGILFSFVLIRLFSHFGILYFPAVLNLSFAALVAFYARRRLSAIAAVLLAVGLIAAASLYNLDDASCNLQFAGQKVVYHGMSPYGMLVVAKDAGQYNFIENGVPLFSTHNVEQVEETVHYAMAQRPDAKKVLLISGGASGTAREILKYPAAKVDYVELDPLVLDVARRFAPEQLDDPRIRVINADGRQYIKQTKSSYDVVIVDMPDPSTSQINRLYTREFFDQAHRVLARDGVLSFSLGGYEGYISKDLARLIAVANRTLAESFKNVLILPGSRNFFLASDGQLTPAIADCIEQAGIRTFLVNRSYVNAMLTPDRMADVRRALSDKVPINEDFNPILYFYHLRYWISQFSFRFGLLEAGLLLILLIYLARLRGVALVIFSGGFAASALEVVLLLGFQIIYGCVYHQVGLIVAMFMLGLAAGSLAMNRFLPRCGKKHLAGLALAIAVYSLCIPYILRALDNSGSPELAWASWSAVPVMTLLLAVLVGMEFPLAGKEGVQDVAAAASRLYTADYIGAALGALLVSTWLIPALGVTAVCMLAAGLNLLAAAAMMVHARQ